MVTNSQVRYGHDLYDSPNKTWRHNGRGFGRHGSRGVIFGGGPLWPEKIEAGIYPLQRHHSPGFEAGQYPGGWIMAVHWMGWYWKKNYVPWKKIHVPGKNIYSPWKRNLGSSGPLVVWSCGPLVLWSSGPLVLWSSGPLVLWSCSAVVV